MNFRTIDRTIAPTAMNFAAIDRTIAATLSDAPRSSVARGVISYPGDRLPPQVTASAPASTVSDAYRFISTKQVVDMMIAEGFSVHSASVRRPRGADASPTGLHLVDFRHPDSPTALGGVVPRVLFMNSHDGSRSAQVLVGAFRLVCSNGLVVGSTIARERARHAGDAAAELVERMRQLSRNTLPMFQSIERWSRKDLTRHQQHEFARLATTLRWGRPDAVATDELLEVRRAGDDAGDLWTVFNRVQEATTRLSLRAVSRNGRAGTTRPLQEVGANTRYNADLWQLAEEFAGM